MGKKRTRRVAETNTEYEQALLSKAEAEVLQNREDDELFVVDRSGSKTSRRKIEKEQSRKEMGVLASTTEEHLVKKKMQEILERRKGDKGDRGRVEEATCGRPQGRHQGPQGNGQPEWRSGRGHTVEDKMHLGHGAGPPVGASHWLRVP